MQLRPLALLNIVRPDEPQIRDLGRDSCPPTCARRQGFSRFSPLWNATGARSEQPERLAAREQNRVALGARRRQLDLDHDPALHALVVRMDVLHFTVDGRLDLADA